MSQRDLAILHSLHHYRLLTSGQLQRLHFLDHHSLQAGQRVCRRVLQRLVARQLVVRLERRMGGVRAGSAGHVYSLASLGARTLELPVRRRHREPGTGFLHHTLAVADEAIRVVEAARVGGITGFDIQTEPRSWRRFYGHGHQHTLKPDLALRILVEEDELHWFVEVDRATESRSVVVRKCQAYTSYYRSGAEQAAHGVFPKVLWVVPTPARQAQIERYMSSAGRIEPALFAVTTTASSTAVLTGGDEEPP